MDLLWIVLGLALFGVCQGLVYVAELLRGEG